MHDEQIKDHPQYLRKDAMELYLKRQAIISKCDILVDGKYIESQRNPSKRWAGSDNQKVIDIQKSLEQHEVVLYCD